MKPIRRGCLFVATLTFFPAAGLAGTNETGHKYVGSAKCKICHMREWNSWSATKMATAFEALKPGARAEAKQSVGLDVDRDYTTDTSCLPCHVTGYGEPGGFVDRASTPNLAGVGCETCHGPGGTYTQGAYMSLSNKEYKKQALVAVGLTEHVAEAQCRNCHNKNSPFVGEDHRFDFQANKLKGTHELFPLKFSH